MTFTSAKKTAPSLKSTGADRLLTSGQKLTLNVETKNMDDYTVSASLLYKPKGGSYAGTGWNALKVTSSTLEVPLGGQLPGSYCLRLTVKK